MTREKALQIRAIIEKFLNNASEEDALEAIDMYPEWRPCISLERDHFVRYNGGLYKVIQQHVSQSDWTPDALPSLFRRVSVEEFAEWIQPLSAVDAYQSGDKVSYEGHHWVSTIDNNVWQPGVYGWDQL